MGNEIPPGPPPATPGIIQGQEVLDADVTVAGELVEYVDTAGGTIQGSGILSSDVSAALSALAYDTVEDEGTPVTQRTSLNFVGAGVTVTDDSGKTKVSIPGGAGEAFPVGAVYINVTGTNPGTELGYGTWSAFGAGRVLVGYDSGDTDFDTAEETGGAKTVASAGSVAAPTISGSTASESAHTHSVTSNVTVADHASHTHTYTDVVNHTHPVNITDPGHQHGEGYRNTGTAGTAGVQGASTANNANIANGVQSNTTGITATTSNPGSGVATGTTAGPSATLTHTPTNNAVTSGAGSSHSHGAGTLAASAPAFTGSSTSVVQPYIVVHFWKRTA